MNGLGIATTVVLGLLLLFMPRRFAVIPMLIVTCYVTFAQEIIVFNFHFTSLRILVLIGCIRIVMRNEIAAIKLNNIDKLVLLWILSNLAMFTLLYQTTAAFVNRLGAAYTAIGIYIFFRAVIRDLDDIKNMLRNFAFIIAPLAVLMIIEHKTGKNIFAILGGVNEISEFRNDKFRSQGAFLHPILAGTMGATMLPLMVSLWWQKQSKHVAVLGIASASTIMITSSSSGPLMAAGSGILGMFAWRYRGSMKIVRRTVAIALILLHFVIMKAPVWYLFDRLSSLVGGSGWYRAELIQQAVTHFSDWWLMGTKDTSDWFAFALQNKFSEAKADITNQYIAEGVNGGLMTMLLLILAIIFCFKAIGHTLKDYVVSNFPDKILVWSMGATLFAHVISFFSVAYFDQIVVFWFLLLAIISSLQNKNFMGINNINMHIERD